MGACRQEASQAGPEALLEDPQGSGLYCASYSPSYLYRLEKKKNTQIRVQDQDLNRAQARKDPVRMILDQEQTRVQNTNLMKRNTPRTEVYSPLRHQEKVAEKP